jgi:hypothetical protein
MAERFRHWSKHFGKFLYSKEPFPENEVFHILTWPLYVLVLGEPWLNRRQEVDLAL